MTVNCSDKAFHPTSKQIHWSQFQVGICTFSKPMAEPLNWIVTGDRIFFLFLRGQDSFPKVDSVNHRDRAIILALRMGDMFILNQT